MEWIDDLKEKTVGLDTSPLIYFIEENPAYIETVRFFLKQWTGETFWLSLQL